MLLLAFDGVLVAIVLWLAISSMVDRDRFRAVMKFILLGLFLSAIWLRLKAPDVALAEAAVGAGLTGALMLAGLSRMRSTALPGARAASAKGLAAEEARGDRISSDFPASTEGGPS